MSVTAQPPPVAVAIPTAPARTLAGAGLALLGLFLFGANNAVMKTMIQHYPATEMIAIRSVLSLLLISPFLRLRDFRMAFRASPPLLHLLRMTMSGLEMTCFFVAVSILPLADASTLYLATPIYVTALSPFLLGERVGWRRWAAVLVGFGGVIVAMRPSRETLSGPASVALLGGVMFSLVVVTTRKLRGAPNQVLIALQLFAALIVGLTLRNSDWSVPTLPDVAVCVGIAMLSVSGYAAFNQSLRIAPASVVSPLQYTSLIWAALFGYLVFGEEPYAATLIGAAIIIGAGLFILWRERVRPAAA